jgi:competence protein ComEA
MRFLLLLLSISFLFGEGDKQFKQFINEITTVINSPRDGLDRNGSLNISNPFFQKREKSEVLELPTTIEENCHYTFKLDRASKEDFMQIREVNEKIAQKIVNFRKNNSLTTIKDLEKIRGLGKTIIGHIRGHIINSKRCTRKSVVKKRKVKKSSKRRCYYKTYLYKFDWKSASRSELIEISGIGEKIAQKIINFRKENPLASLQDLRNAKIGVGKKIVYEIENFTKEKRVERCSYNRKNPTNNLEIVLNNRAKISGKWYRVGDKYGKYTVVKIGVDFVKISHNKNSLILKMKNRKDKFQIDIF